MSVASTNISLPNHQWEWLQTMTKKHKLSSISKAVRICITCVAVGDVSLPRDATTDAAFDTGGREKTTELYPEQFSCIQRNCEDNSRAIRRIMNACASADEYTVFGMVRCKTSIAKCEGAREAAKAVGERYGRGDEVVLGNDKENIQI